MDDRAGRAAVCGILVACGLSLHAGPANGQFETRDLARVADIGPTPAQPKLSRVEVGVRATGAIEHDGKVLSGPAIGGGGDAAVRVAPSLLLGVQAEKLRASLWREGAGCGHGGCTRDEWFVDATARWVIPITPITLLWIENAAGYREHARTSGETGASVRSMGIELWRASVGHDWILGGPFRAGLYVTGAMGCFASRSGPADADLHDTCFEAPFFSAGGGVRLGASF